MALTLIPAQRCFLISFRAPALCLLLLCTQAGLLAAQQTLSLRDAVRIGLSNSPEALASADRVRLQQAQGEQARLRPNPRLYLQSEDLRPWDHTFSFPDSTEDYGYLGETLETGGKRARRIAYAQQGVQRSKAEQQAALQRIGAGIAEAYWVASAADASVIEWQRELAELDLLVHYQADRVRSGATAGVDLLRTQIERDRIALSLAQAQRQQEAARIELARRSAFAAARSAALTDALEQERPVTEVSLTTAVEQRPDVAAARASVEESRRDLELQHADAVPNLDLLGGYKRNVGVDTLYGGLQVDLPIFNRNQGGIATASAHQQLAEDQLALTRFSARSEIEAAASDYSREQTVVRSTLPGMNERASRNAEIINDAYRSGGADLLRYLDAERVLIDTRLLAIETWAGYQRATVVLKLAYGEDQ
jgi:cobalt-zinc-cadmium efflux system outer membrane protein